jgi:hypothetical protein
MRAIFFKSNFSSPANRGEKRLAWTIMIRRILQVCPFLSWVVTPNADCSTVVIAVMVNFYATIEATVGLSKERPMRTPFQSVSGIQFRFTLFILTRSYRLLYLDPLTPGQNLMVLHRHLQMAPPSPTQILLKTSFQQNERSPNRNELRLLKYKRIIALLYIV